eukprot:TRINITY_DN54053_c0_g1_i1.p1 TRINITY_DN54053_c0_g1~~TRINITY_DN54053_c0_g1_i1.p1  ORF type:complete len:493 (-),score=31.24 TRINITY_DN54053_c0_g1_i1:113-1558(-)
MATTPRMSLRDVEIQDETQLEVPLSSLRANILPHVAEHEQAAWNEFCGDIRVIIGTFYHTVFTKYLDILDRLQYTSKCLTDITEEEGTSLLEGITTLIKKADYQPLSQERYNAALEVSFEFVLPCETDWEAVHHPLMSKYTSECSLYPQAPLPSFVNNGVLLFTRGTTSRESTGLFIMEKLDILTEHYWNWLWRWICEKRKKPKPKKTKWVPRPHSRVVQRKTLYEFMKERKFSPIALLKQATLSEPCFKSTIVVHCNSAKSKKKPNMLQMERYQGIPFADLEVVLPLKSLTLRPFDKLVIWSQVICLIFFAINSVPQILYPESASLFILMIGVVTALVVRANQIYTQIQMMKKDYQSSRTAYLQQRRVASGREVPSRLLEEVEEQEIKEVLLAYFLLWSSGSCSVHQLDVKAEEFINKEFNTKMDFDVDSAVSKMKAMRLIQESGGTLSCLVSPTEFVQQNPSLGKLQSLKLTTEYDHFK